MDDTQRIVKCGNLSLHTPGSFFKKRWHSKYLVLYDGSKSGVKRLELFDSEIKFKKQNPARIIPLVDCVRVVTCQRQKTTYTFEVRTSDQFYLLAAQSFQDMNDWVNCLRLVAFGQSTAQQSAALSVNKRLTTPNGSPSRGIDVLLEKRNLLGANSNNQRTTPKLADYPVTSQQLEQQTSQQVAALGGSAVAQSKVVTSVAPVVPTNTHPALVSNPSNSHQPRLTTASQAASAAASALSKTRQRQPSLLGSCKPQPPTDSPFIQAAVSSINPNKTILANDNSNAVGQLDTLTPTVRGQLIAAASKLAANLSTNSLNATSSLGPRNNSKHFTVQPALDEEEENMLYCSIEDNPSEHNYRVKVIETDLSLRCQLKCYQLTTPTTVNQQYEQLGNLLTDNNSNNLVNIQQQPVTFYQLIIGPQELTLLNDYASSIRQQANLQQQGLWSWPYQCIRRYGFDKDNCFMFEAGRKCTSGPGQFIVQTPKAYSIYQDVVKFVNELRSLSNLAGLTEQNTTESQNSSIAHLNNAPKDQNLTSSQSEKQPQLVVTQIPVTWTPNSVANNQNQEKPPNSCEVVPSTTTDTVQSRRQFFDTLRHLNTSDPVGQQQSNAQCKDNVKVHQTSQSPRTNTMINNANNQLTRAISPSSTTTTSEDVIRCPDPSNANTLNSPAPSESNKCDETDESGYEQGDESVTSSKSSSRSRLTGTGNRKRQVNDSMSSASSTSSGGGSPGHSVSRRSNGAVHSGPINTSPGSLASPSKRFSSSLGAQNSTSCPSVVKSITAHDNRLPSKLGIMLNTLADQSEDFEANLIRDVYSEITKLHAKFAVTSGSAEDSMSSHSSNEDDGSGEPETNDVQVHGMTDDQLSIPDGEPMYSNMRFSEASISRSRLTSMNLQADELERSIQNNQQRVKDHKRGLVGRVPQHQSILNQHQTANPYSNHSNVIANNNNSYSTQNNSIDYLSLSRCGPMYPTILNPIPECGEVAQQPSPKQSSTAISKPKRNLSSNNYTENASSKACTNSQKIMNNRKTDSHASKVGRSTQIQQVSAGSTKSKLPTNHYVINDVQYAKISRNLCSKYESCL